MTGPRERSGGPASTALATRAAVASLFALAASAGYGALAGLRRGLGQVDAHGYAELGFARGRELALVQATDHGALGGVHAAWPWIAVAALVLATSRRARELASPPALAAALAEPLSRLRLQVAWAGLFAAAAYAIGRLSGGLLNAEVAWIGATALLSCAALELLGRRAARAAERGPGPQASLAAAVASALAAAPVLFEVDRRRVYRPLAFDTWLATGLVAVGALVGFLVLRRLARRALEPERVARLPLAASAALALCAATAATPLVVHALARAPAEPAVRAQRDFNVVLIGIDTLRADRTMLVEPAPDGRDLTPNLRALAQRGTVFAQATSQSPWTMPAFASIHTGEYPMQHGAISLTGKLRDREVTLAEILRETGRATGGFVSHDYVDIQHGFAQGFDEYSDFWAQGHALIGGGHITDQALDFVARHADRPFFLFAHYFDPHYEYREHAEWDFADAYQGWLRTQLDMQNIRHNRQMLGPAELGYIRDIYDEEIAYTDREIGRLIADLERRGLLEKTVFVVVADHGEEFLEHGNFSHTTALYQELVHVPLFVVVPGGEAGRVVEDVVETRRVFPTVLEALGVDLAGVPQAPGLLAPAGSTAATGAKHAAYSTVWLPDAKPEWGKRFQIAAVRAGRFKLIKDLTRGVTELFDLQSDPGETRDASAAEPERRAELELALDAWISEMQTELGDVPTLELDAATRERLHQLGYM